MALAKRPHHLPSGYEKKHDLPVHERPWPASSNIRGSTFIRRKRFLVAIALLAIVYVFIKYLPTDLPPAGQRYDAQTGQNQGRPPAVIPASAGSRPDNNGVGKGQLFDGPVKFYDLARTLRPHINRKQTDKDNIVFLVHDLRTAPTLIGFACGLATYNRTTVHVAILSLSGESVERIMDRSGVAHTDCPIFVHDARPDYNAQSSMRRRTQVIDSVINHLAQVLKPTCFVVDAQQLQQPLFRNVLEQKLDSIWTPMITIPDHASSLTDWLRGVDGRALALLNRIQMDIVITPYKQSAGCLIRLLNSIWNADYAGLSLPRITVEIPDNVDPFALRYLENFRWPKSHYGTESKLILRRRIDPAQANPATASLRTLESFYPPSDPMSHVLVLTPDVELSPNYLQYLTYLTLEYKYGRNGQRLTSSLMGISLFAPSTALNNEEQDNPLSNKHHSLFLRPSLTNEAALYFGDKWVELQNYLSLRLRHDPTLSKTLPDTNLDHSQPAWLAQLSELMQARNYFMLHRSASHINNHASDPNTHIGLWHPEAHQSPEEYWVPPIPPVATAIPTFTDSTVLTADESESSIDTDTEMSHEQPSKSLPVTSLLGLSDREILPPDFDLPIFGADGQKLDFVDAEGNANAFADRVSLELGGCRELEERDEKKMGRIGYLFCEDSV